MSDSKSERDVEGKMPNKLLLCGLASALIAPAAFAQNQLTPQTACIQCETGGVIRGQAQNGSFIDETFSGNSKMCINTMSLGGETGPYINFTRNGEAWPSLPWGVRANSWSITCAE